eukprot:TRINITY_DN19139_c0_g1_i1.p1 TRINITY_DN19139_c0_g1~~TRINITY_DN19139_c0_g1_i1.p1  ORF type:complete len:309 (+),score=35.10 TRINITY_DN19139_c0_g1_i1:41-928(+)
MAISPLKLSALVLLLSALHACHVHAKTVAVGGWLWVYAASNFSDWAKATPLSVGDVVSFNYSCCHNVYSLPNQAAFDACDFSSSTDLGASTDEAAPIYVNVTTIPQWIICTAHCLYGQKVLIQAGYGKSSLSTFKAFPQPSNATYVLPWVLGATNFTAWAAETPLKVGDTVALQYSGVQDVYLMASQSAWDSCDFTGSTMLGDTAAGSDGGVIITVTSTPQYITTMLANGKSCSTGGVKLVVAAAGSTPMSSPSTAPAPSMSSPAPSSATKFAVSAVIPMIVALSLTITFGIVFI